MKIVRRTAHKYLFQKRDSCTTERITLFLSLEPGIIRVVSLTKTPSALAKIPENMSIRKIVLFICFAVIFLRLSFPAFADENRWWPVQVMPKALVRLRQNELPEPRAACEMMAQSVAGLAAKAVNESRADEMVWVGTDNIDIEDWLARLLKRHPQLELRGSFAL